MRSCYSIFTLCVVCFNNVNMLTLQTHTSFSFTLRPFNNPNLTTFKPHSHTRASRSSLRITSSSSNQGIVEHIVLVKIKDDTEPAKVKTLVNVLKSLSTLDGVLYREVGPVLRHGSTKSGLRFTHMLHTRYSSKEDLASYTVHPRHVTVANEFLFPVCDDLMVVDWVAGDSISLLPPPAKGSGLRVSFLKLKESNNDEVKEEVLGAVRGIKDGGVGGIVQLSCGENFSPERAKGFTIASLAVFPGRRELESVEWDEGLGKVVKNVEDALVVDYVLP